MHESIRVNPAQKRAIIHFKGPALVVAGPGSGKTFVITQRIRYLISHHGVSPEKIMVITFTRAAAEEMKQRASALLLREAEKITFGTFHSIFFHMLKVSLPDGEKCVRTKEGKIDYDAIIVECCRMLKENEEIRRYWQEQFHYLLIDEYQDVNSIQAETVKLLLNQERNLFVVGDDDQAIYGFRGADPSVMLRFPEEYQGTEKIILDTNYRSDAFIVEAAGRVIGENKMRFQKRITASKAAEQPVDITSFAEEGEEYQCLADWCRKHPEEMEHAAVIVRTNREIRRISRILLKEHIPFFTKERVRGLYDGFPGKDIFAYLQIASGREERGVFYQIMNKPARCLIRDSIMEESDVFSSMQSFYRKDKQMSDTVKKFEKEMGFLKNLRPYAAFRYILNGIGYLEYAKNYAKEHQIDWEEIEEELTQIAMAAKQYVSVKEWVEDAENDTGGEKMPAEKCQKMDKGICLCTMHASKGLEYDTVFLTDVNEGVIPYRKAKQLSRIEEERRMFYVALTRAKKQLHIWYVKNLRGKEVYPSEFLEPLLKTMD